MQRCIWWDNNALQEVQQARAMGSGFEKEKMAHLKHESAKWCARAVPSLATSCAQSLLRDGFAIKGVKCSGREMEVMGSLSASWAQLSM